MYLVKTQRLTVFVCRNLPRSDQHRRSLGVYTFRHAGRTGRLVWLGPLHAQVITT